MERCYKEKKGDIMSVQEKKKQAIETLVGHICKVYTPTSRLCGYVKKGLEKLSLAEVHGLLLMIETSLKEKE